MHRYFFNVRDGQDFPDTEGTILSGDDEARQEALRASAEILRAPPKGATFWTGEDWTMEVTEGARVVAMIRFSGTIPS